MTKLFSENIIHEITPLSEKDCFYVADRRKKGIYISYAFS